MRGVRRAQRAAVPARLLLELRGLGVTVVDPCWLVPVDAELVRPAATYRLVVTLEDAAPAGGFGKGVARALRSVTGGAGPSLRCLALPEGRFIASGGRDELLREHHLDVDGILEAVTEGLA